MRRFGDLMALPVRRDDEEIVLVVESVGKNPLAVRIVSSAETWNLKWERFWGHGRPPRSRQRPSGHGRPERPCCGRLRRLQGEVAAGAGDAVW